MKGGEEKVEEVRLGLLQFQREVDGMKKKVSQRRGEVEELFGERMKVSKEIRAGRDLLEVEERLEELEEVLRVNKTADAPGDNAFDADFTESDDDSDDDDDDETEGTISTSQLRRRIQQFVYVKRLIGRIGPAHPFLVKQEDRVSRLRQTMLLDLNGAMAESKALGSGIQGLRVLKVMALYSALDEPYEALSAVRGQKRL